MRSARRACGPVRRAGTLLRVRGVAIRLGMVVALSATVGAVSAAAPASHAAAGGRRAALPAFLKLVDQSRSIRLPDGKREPRRVWTYLWYPPRQDGPGPFPLVVFGHGYATTPRLYRPLLRAWARAGYVVAAPLFPLENANAPGGPDESDLVNQPRDMSFVISQLLAASASATDPLHGLLDPTRIAVAGQSDGAETAFAVAYERPWRDRRVRAAVILSGAELGNDVPLDRHAAPLLAVQGTADRINPPHYTRSLFRAVARPKYLLFLLHAGHLGPYTVPGVRFAAVARLSIAFLDRYLGHGSVPAIRQAVAGLPNAILTSDP
jgi:dienelactone hydrolase